MVTALFNRNRTNVTASRLHIFLLDDSHVRDYPYYGTFDAIMSYAFGGFQLVAPGTGTHIYDPAAENQMTAQANGNYIGAPYAGTLIPDHTEYSANSGCRDVYGEIRVVEILQGNDISSNIASGRLYVKTSVGKQIAAESFTEVDMQVFLYEDNSNVRSDSETDSLVESGNYQTDADVSDITDPDELRCGPIKNFHIHDLPLDSVLGNSFSFELRMNSEGVLYEAIVQPSNRKERGNAS